MEPARDPASELRTRYAEHGQGHVFDAWDRLGAGGRARLLAQAHAIDPGRLARVFAAALALRASARGRMAPPEVVRVPERGGDPALHERARARGVELLEGGAVAALVVAGGQGTRLGFDGPKGAFPLGPVSGRTLFEQQAQKLRRAAARYGRSVAWLVMTSDATDEPCRELFERASWFGLPPEDVRFFRQASMPAVDFDGRILLEAPDRVALSPEGHGGVIPALAEAGLLDWLAERGVRVLSYSQVDNPLVRVVDPVFLGLHALRGAEMSCKVLAKRAPDERAGTVGVSRGRVHVIEYTEVDPWHRDARGPDGELLFWAASIAIHALDVTFVRRVAARADDLLPHHASPKRIPCLDRSGRPLVPESPNGYKLERFVFDALPEAARVALLEVRRSEEYSPIKNRCGAESPRTAREDLVACYHRWLRAAGVTGVDDEAWIELDESRVDGPQDLRRAKVEPGADWISFGSRDVA
jgi:UDP-N-acetylglucosamine/UDP-N-acetylgalactosamine diphosphorylase